MKNTRSIPLNGSDSREDKQLRVLIVDDEEEIRDLLCGYLAEFDILAEGVGDGAALRAALETTKFDLLVLDLMLPGEDGLSICRELRTNTGIGIIMLTARGELVDRVVGLEVGADDYMTKPFDTRELVARIRTVMRRAHAPEQCYREKRYFGSRVAFNGWELDRIARQLVTPQNMIVPLSHAEFRLLSSFIERPHCVLSRDQLMDASRGYLSSVLDRSIDLLVSRLRQKMGDDPKAPKFLKTIRGEGYLFDAKVIQ